MVACQDQLDQDPSSVFLVMSCCRMALVGVADRVRLRLR
jgi:hypothetical protein